MSATRYCLEAKQPSTIVQHHATVTTHTSHTTSEFHYQHTHSEHNGHIMFLFCAHCSVLLENHKVENAMNITNSYKISSCADNTTN